MYVRVEHCKVGESRRVLIYELIKLLDILRWPSYSVGSLGIRDPNPGICSLEIVE